jgi:hypothetical protein
MVKVFISGNKGKGFRLYWQNVSGNVMASSLIYSSRRKAVRLAKKLKKLVSTDYDFNYNNIQKALSSNGTLFEASKRGGSIEVEVISLTEFPNLGDGYRYAIDFWFGGDLLTMYSIKTYERYQNCVTGIKNLLAAENREIEIFAEV